MLQEGGIRYASLYESLLFRNGSFL